MANISDLTRKEQVLARLRAANGGWVDGPEIANEAVGGSEGLRRLRELADEGHNIRKRHHPDTTRDIWQYRLGPPIAAVPAPEEAAEILDSLHTAVKAGHGTDPAVQQQLLSQTAIEPAEKPVYPKSEPPRPQTHIRDAIKRKEDGTFEYVPPQRPIHEPEQLTALPDTPQPAERKFDALPKGKLDYGSVAVCPRCRSKTTRGRPPKEVDESALTPAQRRTRERKQKEATRLVDEDGVLLFKDPFASKSQPCQRCNGYGVVPNVGPIPITMP